MNDDRFLWQPGDLDFDSALTKAEKLEIVAKVRKQLANDYLDLKFGPQWRAETQKNPLYIRKLRKALKRRYAGIIQKLGPTDQWLLRARDYQDTLLKFNENHDDRGRFASSDGTPQGRLDHVNALNASLGPDGQHSAQATINTYDNKPGQPGRWDADRERVHDQIVQKYLDDAKAAGVKSENKAIFMGGLPGAGKTAALNSVVADSKDYLTVNPDLIKEDLAQRGMIPQLGDLKPMESNILVHEEASKIAKELATRAQASGMNILWDITSSSKDSVGTRLKELHDVAGPKYETTSIFVDVPIKQSLDSVDWRYRKGIDDPYGSRAVPHEVIEQSVDPKGEYDSVNRRVFEETKGAFDHWFLYSNLNRQFKLVAKSS
jgi:hypothetical protein